MTPRSAGATARKTADLYLGDWELIPELCVYEFGSAPVTGAYLIAKQGRKLRITIEWSMSAGTEAQSTGFEAPPDGSPQPVDGPAVDQIERDQGGVFAGGGEDGVVQLLQPALRPPGGDHMRAGLRQRQGALVADAARSPDDEGDAVFEGKL